MLIELISVLLLIVKCATSMCDWPDTLANTVWHDSSKGDITFTTDTLTGWNIKVTAAKGEPEYDTWKCHSTALYQSNNIVVAITTNAFVLFDKPFYAYLCFQLTEITQSSYRYYLMFRINTDMNNERVGALDDGGSENWGLLCHQDDNYASYRPSDSEYRVMIKSDNVAAAKIDCPYTFLGSYDYTHTLDGITSCDSTDDVLSTCTNSQEISFDYNTCNTKVAYSESNQVWCVDTVPSGGNNYVTLYNGNDADAVIDNVNIFRFSCIVISSDGSKASIVPNSCRKDQTPESVPAQNGQSNGATLTLTKSTESCLTCPLLTAPDSGTVSVSTNGAVTSASFNCSSEYSLAGPDTRVCQADDTWSDENPTCTCILPDSPANGSLLASVDGTLTYSCDVGFVLNGDRTRTCQPNSNTWSGVEPSCEPCDVITVTSGLAITPASTGTTTISSFTCSAGYTLDGSFNATCLLAGTWDTNAPNCLLCENITNTDTLQVAVTTDGYTSTATFTCVTGYHVVGASSVTCDITGTWESIPKCECDEQVASSNGSRVGNGTNSQFTCNVGYNLIGSSVAECLDDGTGWSADPPSCDGCYPLTSPVGGYYNLSTDGKVTLATYRCNVGYTMSGQQLSYCMSDGSWNGTAPSCVECPDLTDPDSGTVSTNTDGVTSTAQYACASDYDISDETMRTCQTDGTWTNTPPTCSCSPASVPANGVILSDNGESVYYQCDVNYSMNGSSFRECSTDGTGWSDSDPTCVQCETLNSITGGSIVSSTDGFSTKVQYSCDVGYSINGKKEITCSSDGTLDSSQSTCTQCGTLTTPSGGNFTLYSDGNTVTKATFTCDVGYTLDGYSESTCQNTGLWDNATPQCVQCKDRGHPASGNFRLSTDGQTTSGTYTCADGYILEGQQTISCRIDGNWNYPPSECKCETPTELLNGNVIADGKIVTFSCDTGFTMSGDSTGTCNSDGTGWSIATPQCAQCESLDSFTSGNFTYTSDGSTTNVEYSCPEGSSLQGNPVATCNSSGKWEADLPECMSCPALQLLSVSTGSVILVTNGTTTTAQYSCPQGYEVKGSQTLTCNSDGTWSNEPSDCVCETPTIPDGGNFTISEDGLSVSFTCGEGYTMVGEQTIACDTDGSGWTIEYPNCTKCEDLTTPSNGNITLLTSGTQTTAIYSCGVGYTLDGSTVPTCQEDGTWTTVELTCVSCPELPNLAVTGASVTKASNGTTTTATYTCPTGYEVSGSDRLTCNSSGAWDSDPSTCVCETPPSPLFGTVTSNKTTAIYSCEEGYILKGVSVRTCQDNGQGWTESTPSCTTCDSLSSPTDGSVNLTSNGTVTMATFSCDDGFSMNGTQTMVCLEDGSWSKQAPNCVACPALAQPSSGSLMISSNSIQTSAIYACASGYYIVGEDKLSCSSQGEWSANEPFCACDNVTSPENGNVNISVENGVATYTCDLGYSIDGVASRTCATDGSGWSGLQPSCVGCPGVNATTGGNFEVVSDGTVSSVKFQCDKGATIDGPVSLTCQSDGTWTSAQPTCVSCPDLEVPSSGDFAIDTDGQISTVTYTCADNYEVHGDVTQQCQTDGTWSGSNTTCVCAAPESPANGSVTLKNNKLFAEYTCDIYFSLIGDRERTCQTGGSGWTGSDPSCGQCVALSSPANGSISTNTNGTHTISTFTCSFGTSMQGEATSVCMQDSTWSSAEPSCVTCQNVLDPSSGSVTLSTDGTKTVAEYACVSGYYVSGQNKSTCLPDGSWSNTDTECLCEDPYDIANGTMSVDGEKAQFQCNIGFSLSGNSVITCNSDGTGWNGQVPKCIRCNDIIAPSGGEVSYTTNGITTTAGFKCDVGASLNGSTSLMCQVDGTWNGTAPSCVICEDLVTPANGAYTMSTDGTTTTLKLQCNDGFEAAGNTVVECGIDGQWIYSQQSTCDKVSDENSLLNVLIGVSVVSLVIIATLSIFLTIFVYLYLKKKRGESKYATTNVMYFDSTEKKAEDVVDFKPMKMSRPAAPVSHQHSAFDITGPFSTSPAPEGFTGNGAIPETPLSVETHRSGKSVISFKRSATTIANKNYPAVNSISIAEAKETKVTPTAFSPKNSNGHLKPTDVKVSKLPLHRLSPIPNHEQMIGKLGSASPQITKVKKESQFESVGRQSPVDGRPQSVMSHALSVASCDSKSLDRFSVVAD